MNYETAYAQDAYHSNGHYQAKEDYHYDQHHHQQHQQHHHISATAEMEEYEHDKNVQPPDSPPYEHEDDQDIAHDAAIAHASPANMNAVQQQPQPRTSIDIVPSLDITYELKFIKERLAALARDNDPDDEAERLALLEIEQSTEALIESRTALSEQQQRLAALDANDNSRPALLADVATLLTESKNKERQWTAKRETYYREFGSGTAVVITGNNSTTANNSQSHNSNHVGLGGMPEPIAPIPRQLTPAEAELRARTEMEIKQLQHQIAHLQKQLDAIAARRRQMAIDAEEYQRRMEY
ncbi:hypothetical protein BGZ94_009083 [Podila epigama]|nr:hypothetical protein BGZ94_009083 [Podila epigama]